MILTYFQLASTVLTALCPGTSGYLQGQLQNTRPQIFVLNQCAVTVARSNQLIHWEQSLIF